MLTVIQFFTQFTHRSHFLCDDWLAVDESDGAVERVMLVAGDEEMKRFTTLFSLSTQKDFSDGHLWFSCKCSKRSTVMDVISVVL